MISRRKFLAITASFVGTAGRAEAAAKWSGIAFGAEASITLHGPLEASEAALAAAKAEIERAESLFSLYRPASWISHLNREGRAKSLAPVQELLTLCDLVYRLTDGLFDPTIQALWSAAAHGQDAVVARRYVDWRQVALGPDVRLGPRQSLTLNGIAQGWATDRVAGILAAHGFTNALINIGEFKALEGDWRIGVSDPNEGVVRTINLSSGAVAASSPQADVINRQPHIFGPSGQVPIWSTVAVEASTAALADALSTALCLAPRDLVREVVKQRDVTAITLVASNGDLEVLR